MTPYGIEPATFRLVQQWLNQLPPIIRISISNNYVKKSVDFTCSECLYEHERKNYCCPCQLQPISLTVVHTFLGLNYASILSLTLTGPAEIIISTSGVRSGQSQSLTTLSSPDEARNRPSGEHRKLDTWPPWASRINVCSLWGRNDESEFRTRVPLEHALHSETRISGIIL
jgi:hypothetical protein